MEIASHEQPYSEYEYSWVSVLDVVPPPHQPTNQPTPTPTQRMALTQNMGASFFSEY